MKPIILIVSVFMSKIYNLIRKSNFICIYNETFIFKYHLNHRLHMDTDSIIVLLISLIIILFNSLFIIFAFCYFCCCTEDSSTGNLEDENT